jgi:hypothetical protein
MTKRTPDDLLRSIDADVDEQSVDAAIEGVLDMKPDERRAELRAAGYDVGALDAKADAMHDAARRAAVAEAREKAEHEARTRELSPHRRRPAVLWLVAATMVVAAGATLYALRAPAPTPTPPPPLATPSAPLRPAPDLVARAADLRRDAFAACDRAAWTDCLAKLDQARAVDPAGDSAPDVARARTAAQNALESVFGDSGFKPKP